MRLINVRRLELREFLDHEIPPYVILSHRWETAEISFQDFELNKGRNKPSYHKIERLCEIASCDVEWVWLDTCCIDKRNLTELSEAINSMYRWYKQSQYCVAYLFDVEGLDNLASSSWFQRCWTLQELIAPADVRFFDRNWIEMGQKSNMVKLLSSITRIDEHTLRGGDPTLRSVAQRMSWAAHRQATRVEDEAYSLLGLFDMSMPMLYGDGQRAFQTLQTRILETSDDQSIFAWSLNEQQFQDNRSKSYRAYRGSLMAPSPVAFANCQNIIPIPRTAANKTHGFATTNVGIQLILPTRPYKMQSYEVALDCVNGGDDSRVVIFLQSLDEDGEFTRIEPWLTSTSSGKRFEQSDAVALIQKMHVRRLIQREPVPIYYGFRVMRLEFPNCLPRETAEAVIFSRSGHSMQYSGDPLLTTMPSGRYGTVAVIIPPPRASYTSWLQFKCLHLGFDSEFKPFCVVEHSNASAGRLQRVRMLHDQRWSFSEGRDGSSKDIAETLETLQEEIETFDGAVMKVRSDHPGFDCCSLVGRDDCGLQVMNITTSIPRLFRQIDRRVKHNFGTGIADTDGSHEQEKRSEMFARRPISVKMTVAKVLKTRRSSIYLEDHGLAVEFELAVSHNCIASEPTRIWNVYIFPISKSCDEISDEIAENWVLEELYRFLFYLPMQKLTCKGSLPILWRAVQWAVIIGIPWSSILAYQYMWQKDDRLTCLGLAGKLLRKLLDHTVKEMWQMHDDQDNENSNSLVWKLTYPLTLIVPIWYIYRKVLAI